MHRCFIEPEKWAEGEIRPSDSETHHLRDVLRAEDGDLITVFDGAGRQARATIRINPAGDLALDVSEVVPVAERAVELVLIQAIPKGARMDLVVEKATELGVARIIPVVTDRGVVRLDAKQAGKRATRWDRIARSASKQCGTPWIPQIEAVQSYAGAVKRTPEFDAVLLCSLVEGVEPLRDVIARLQLQAPTSIAVIIGPEGDLTPSEISDAIEAGAVPVSLGGLTLRVETAALYAASVLAHEFLWR